MANLAATSCPISYSYNPLKKPSTLEFAFCKLYKVAPAGYKDKV